MVTTSEHRCADDNVYLDCNIISGDTLANIVVSRDEVLKKVKQLDKNKGPEPDGISAYFVQRTDIELTEAAEQVERYAAEKKITWKYSPPGAPHMGGA
ncbi:hypothetical protein EVAR_44221_1 [Eumeta japonica]|uniref:Uncharacterized protein n=1 Tax=Eumeta variegata TaxID=151549 RepID=A0A4C1W0V5_EUMVA|nr:hypothetical protein EVAR_44221_1 [Eumeta japonica]